MDFESFFFALKDNGKTGGLFVASLIGFFVAIILTLVFWQAAVGLALFILVFWLLVWLAKSIWQMDHKLFGVILFFSLILLSLLGVATVARTLLDLDIFMLVLPVASFIAILYSLGALKFYLCLSNLHKIVYVALPLAFAATAFIYSFHK